jgi:uncharacterized membrane protein YdbT with pleckstrin-like domain
VRTTLKPDERVVAVAMRHRIILLWYWVAIALSLVVAVIAFAAGGGGAPIGWTFTFAAVAFGVALLFSFLDRKATVWVVTNVRVIQESGVLSHRTSEFPLDKINNIDYEQSLLGRVFKYGDVTLQTAAEFGASKMTFIADPKTLKDAVTKSIEDYRARQTQDDAQRIARVLGTSQLQSPDSPRTPSDARVCPFCAETIKAKAVICRFCNRELPPG